MTIKTCDQCESVDGSPHQPACTVGKRLEREKCEQQARALVARKTMRGVDTFKVLEGLLEEIDILRDCAAEQRTPIPAEETARAIALLARKLDPESLLFSATAFDQLTEEQFTHRVAELLEGWAWGSASEARAEVEAMKAECAEAIQEGCSSTVGEGLPGEAVDGPRHYGGKGNDYEAIVVMVEWFGPDATAAFCRLNAVKYLQRAGMKFEGRHPMEVLREDLKKAAWYCETAARILETGKAR